MRPRLGLGMTVVLLASLLPRPSMAARPATAYVEPGLLEARSSVKVLARFHDRVPDAVARFAGLDVHYRFRSEPAIYATATAEAVRALASRDDLAYLEGDKPIEFTLDSATVASRARDVWAPRTTAPIRDGAGDVVDGRGVGIAIVDTGLDGLHPDYFATGKIGGNWQVTPAGMVPAPYTSTPNDGHGTHVAGIAAGNGAASGGLYQGAAPGATLYAFNMFAGIDGTVVFPAIAFDWILQNGANQDPPIRVVNNSWRCLPRVCANVFDAGQLHQRLASRLAESGIVVTWAAGNEGGDGANAMTNASAQNPTPGVISVANYIDELGAGQVGVRNNRVSGTSSRGDSSDPVTWPDVAAPGATVTSTWATVVRPDGQFLSTRNPVSGANTYWTLNGTSMAAPHVAGIVALMLQANPALKPSEVEYILKATATKLPNPIGYVRADPAHPYDGANYAEGHGLVDALAAVQTAASFGGPPAPPAPEPIPESFLVSTPGVQVDQTLYLTDELGMQSEYPSWTPTPQTQRIRQSLTYTSAPFTETTRFDALTGDLFVGTAHEWFVVVHLSLQFRLTARKISATGVETRLGEATSRVWFTATMAPIHRRFSILFPEAELAPGDRLAVDLTYQKRPGSEPSLSDAVLTDGAFGVYTGQPTASRIGIGRTVKHPARGSAEYCRAREYCADIGGNVEVHSVTCANVPTRLQWQGPAGSALVFTCDGHTFVCAVPGRPNEDADGSCDQTVDVHFPAVQADGQCLYRTADGTRAGRGRCEALTFLRS